MIDSRLLYKTLGKIPNVAVDQALAAALPTADPDTLHRITLALLDRAEPQGLLSLALNYHRLPEPAQQRVCEQAGDLFAALRKASRHKHGRGPLNAIAIVRRSGTTRLAYLVSDQLRHGSEQTAAASAECLLEMARQAAAGTDSSANEAESEGPPPMDPIAVDFLLRAVDEAVASFGQHRRDESLLAMAELVPRPMPRAAEALSDSRRPAAAQWQRLLRQAQSPAVARILFLMMAKPGVGMAALGGLRQACRSARLGFTMQRWHDLLLPEVQAGLSRARNPHLLVPAAQHIEPLPPAQRRGVPTYLANLPLDPRDAADALHALREDADDTTRLAALRQLLSLRAGSEKAVAARMDKAIADFGDDAQPVVARIALHHLIRVGYAELPKLLAHLVNSPHESLRRLAGQRLGSVGFKRLWEVWPRLDASQRLAAGRALVKVAPDFHRLLTRRLGSPDPAARRQARVMQQLLAVPSAAHLRSQDHAASSREYAA